MNQCYYCKKDIKGNLDFCSECSKPLVSCPKCGKYFTPFTNFCNQCQELVFLGDIEIPSHNLSNTAKMLEFDLNNIKEKNLSNTANDDFIFNPLIKLGYIFIVSQNSLLYVINSQSLDEYETNRLPIRNIRTNPILIKLNEQKTGKKLYKYYLSVASDDEIIIVSIERGNPVSIEKIYKSWKLDGLCRTDPLFVKDKIIIGTTQGIFAYKLDGTIIWKYSLSDQRIITPLTLYDETIFFGGKNDDGCHIHSIDTNNGYPVWDQAYSINSAGITDIYKTDGLERLIFFDYDGCLHNLDASKNGGHFAPVINALVENGRSVQPSVLGIKDRYIFVASASGCIHCMDLYGTGKKERYDLGRNMSFHFQPAIASDSILFVSSLGDMFFIDIEKTLKISNRVEVIAKHIAVKGEIKTSPITSGRNIYVLSNIGKIYKIG